MWTCFMFSSFILYTWEFQICQGWKEVNHIKPSVREIICGGQSYSFLLPYEFQDSLGSMVSFSTNHLSSPSAASWWMSAINKRQDWSNICSAQAIGQKSTGSCSETVPGNRSCHLDYFCLVFCLSEFFKFYFVF